MFFYQIFIEEKAPIRGKFGFSSIKKPGMRENIPGYRMIAIPALFFVHERIAVIGRWYQGLLDRPGRSPADHIQE